MHGFLSRDGVPPGDLLEARRREVAGYGGDVQAGQALSAARDGNGFAIELDTGGVNLATDRVGPADAGAASAMVNAGQPIGAAIGTALLNTIAVSAMSSYLANHPKAPDAAAQASVHGNTVAFWVTVVVFVLGALACGLIVRPGRQLGSTDSEPTPTTVA
jgi:hypothetical protein